MSPRFCVHIPDFHTIFWRIAVTSAYENVGTFCMIFQYTIGIYSQVLVSNQAMVAKLSPLMHLDHAWLDAYMHYHGTRVAYS